MSYQYFADFYDKLTVNVDYIKTADYLIELFSHYNHNPGITLDLACGTGSLTVELAKRGIDIYGADASIEMLSVAQKKAYDNGFNILFLNQKMEELDLYGTINTCICCLDSINHITDKFTLKEAFKRVSLFMEKDGFFIFDCNTLYKHKNILADNVFVYDEAYVYCVWQNRFNENNNTVAIQLDFFEPDSNGKYQRYTENFSERAYSIPELSEMLIESGFEIEGIFDERSFDAPKSDSQRIFFVSKKI